MRVVTQAIVILRQPFWDGYVGVPVYSVSQKSRDTAFPLLNIECGSDLRAIQVVGNLLSLKQGSSVSRTFSVTGQILSKKG